MLHLVDAGQDRENLAVDRLITLMPGIHDRWYESVGLDPWHHWALVRPKLSGIHPRYKEIEIDVVLGPVTATGRLAVDQLVAVEAKCWKKTWADVQAYNGGPHANSNLWDQVLRNREVGFGRVTGLDIVVTPPGDDYWGALRSAEILGRHEREWLVKLATPGRAAANAGYALLAFGAVSWKDESESGTLPMFECEDAPEANPTSGMLRVVVGSILDQCPKTGSPPYWYRKSADRWTPHHLG